MKTKATNLRRVENLDTIPDGQYEGTWGGYHVTFTAGGVTYEAQTRDGIRTMAAPCIVTVNGGKIEVEVKPKA